MLYETIAQTRNSSQFWFQILHLLSGLFICLHFTELFTAHFCKYGMSKNNACTEKVL